MAEFNLNLFVIVLFFRSEIAPKSRGNDFYPRNTHASYSIEIGTCTFDVSISSV